MARLALSKLGLSGNLLKTSIDWPRLDKAGPGWTRPAWAGQGQWKSPFRVVDWPGPAWAGLGRPRPGQASVIFRFLLAWAGLGRPRPAMSCLGQPRPAWAGPGQPSQAAFLRGDQGPAVQKPVNFNLESIEVNQGFCFSC